VAPPGSVRPAINGARDISDICTTQLTRCQSTSGATPAFMSFYFEAVITLAPCNSWQVWATGECCRNTPYANATGSYVRVQSEFNSLDFPTNCAPNFADEIKPLPAACVGQQIYYGVGTVDPDGDSLRFELTRALDQTTNMSYIGGYSYSQPMQLFSIDSSTGLITARSNVAGKFVVAF
jgi:hypothetical protein